MKIFNRGVDIKVKNEDALKVNGVQIIDKDGVIYGDIHAAAGSIGATELASDAVTTAKILNANVTAAKLATDAVETAKIKDLNVTTGKVAENAITKAKLALAITASHIVKYFVLGSTITGVTLTGVVAGDLVVTILADGTVTVGTVAAPDTLPADPADTSYVVIFRATA